MSQVFDALKRSGALLPALDSAIQATRDMGLTALDQAPCFQPHASAHDRLAALSNAPNIGAEKVRMLATRLVQMQRQKQLKTLLITSSIKDEGKSVLTANIAIALAGMQKRVLLLDGDFHQGTLAGGLGAGRGLGLEGWWRTERPIVNFLTKMRTLPLWFLGAGRPLNQALEMLQSVRMSTLLNQLAATFDWVIIDSPPLAPLADSSIWAGLSDGALMVTRLKRTPTKVLTKVLDSIDQRKLLGVVVNECEDKHQSYYASSYSNIFQK